MAKNIVIELAKQIAEKRIPYVDDGSNGSVTISLEGVGALTKTAAV